MGSSVGHAGRDAETRVSAFVHARARSVFLVIAQSQPSLRRARAPRGSPRRVAIIPRLGPGPAGRCRCAHTERRGHAPRPICGLWKAICGPLESGRMQVRS